MNEELKNEIAELKKAQKDKKETAKLEKELKDLKEKSRTKGKFEKSLDWLEKKFDKL